MISPHRFRTSRRIVIGCLALFGGCLTGSAQPAAGPAASGRAGVTVGVVTGRVLNANSGNYLNHARVVVEGTTLETFTGENGDYRLGNVPAGSVRIVASFTGLEARSALVTISPGSVVQKDFDLSLPSISPATDREIVRTILDRIDAALHAT